MNKKGAALAYALIATMILMILSTSLFTAAGSNLTLSTKNTEARQSYITCKSAVEYAKSVILQRANSAKDKNAQRENENPANSSTSVDTAATVGEAILGSATKEGIMHSFWVEPDSSTASGLKAINVSAADSANSPDGKTTYAKCELKLNKVIRTVYRTVAVSTSKSGGGYTVSAKNQIVTNKMKDTNLGLDDSNWESDVITDILPVPASVDSSSEVNSTTVFFVRYVFAYDVQITAKKQYSASDDRMQTLSYETDCTIGGREDTLTVTPSSVNVSTVSPGIQMFAVGGQYGGAGGNGSLVNSNNNDGYNLAPNAASNMSVVFKRPIYATGNSGSISAPSVYFMSSPGLTVGNMQSPSANGNSATITSNFVYFNGNIQGTKNDQGSWLKLYKRDTNSAGIVQFNNTTITLLHPDNSLTTKTLNGLYYFNNDSKDANNYTDLFDFSSFDSKLKQVPESDYAKISSVVNQDYVSYLQTNIDNIVSGEKKDGNNSDDFAGWVGQGRLGNGTPSTQAGKTVYCYASNCDGWGNSNILDTTYTQNYPNPPYSLNTDCHPYAAKSIIFSWVGNSALAVPENRTATFQADYIAMSTNQQAIWTWASSSRFLVKSVNEKDPLTMVFPADTVIRYVDSSGKAATYTITAGTYSAVPSGTNLFSSAAATFFGTPANHTYDGVSGSVKYGSFTGVGDKLEDVTAPNFLLYGAKYGGQPSWVYNNVNTPGFIENTSGNGSSAYPVLFNQPMQIPSGRQNRNLSAPQVYFMGTGNSIYGYNNSNGSAQIHSDFIYYGGNQMKLWNGNSLKIYGYSDSAKGGIIYFAQDCTIYKQDNFWGDITLWIPKGCYSFSAGIDLFNLNVKKNAWGSYYTNDLSYMDQAAIDKSMKNNYVNYIEQQHSNIISGDTTAGGNAPKNAGANWAPNGVLSETTSNTFDGKDVYLYVNDATKWGSAKVNYQASRINLQYVNASSLLVGKSVTFTADNLSLNGQKTDIAQTDDKLILQQSDAGSEFTVRTLSGTGYVTITLPHDLLVKCSSGDSYTVPAGVYKVKNGTNLFAYTSGNGTTITLEKIQIDPVKTFFKKGKYTNE